MKNKEVSPVMLHRKKEFELIRSVLIDSVKFSNQEVVVAEGDSLKLLKKMPSHSVSLILTDPPYHSTKKDNIRGDKSFREDLDYVRWLSEYSKEWHRVLKQNGSLFCFCSSALSAQLEVAFSDKFNILSQIVWTKPNEPGFDGWKQKMNKEALRQWYPHSERIIFAEPAHGDNIFRSHFGYLLGAMRNKAGLTMHKLTQMVGAHGKVNHGGAVSNWEAGRNIPTLEQYNKICSALLETGKIEKMSPYGDAVRHFKTNGSENFTDIWNFRSVRPYKSKHPAEKPIDLLQHAIKSTTYEGDIVLDCFSGSGNTAVAALNLGRLAVLMDIDPKWTSKSKSVFKEKTQSLNIYHKL